MMLARLAAAAALLAVALLPASAAAAPRGEAKKLLAPAADYARDVADRKEEMRAAVKAALDANAPCQAHIDELLKHKQRAPATSVYLMFDAVHAIAPAVQADAERAAQRLRRMTLRDRSLRAYARVKAREIRATLLMPELDICAMLEQWKADEYREEDAPDPFVSLDAATKRDLLPPARVFNRAARRLRKLGARRSQILDLMMTPLVPVVLAELIPEPPAGGSDGW